MRKYVQQYVVFVCAPMCNLLGFALLFATIANTCEFSGKDAVKFNLPHVEKLKKKKLLRFMSTAIDDITHCC